MVNGKFKHLIIVLGFCVLFPFFFLIKNSVDPLVNLINEEYFRSSRKVFILYVTISYVKRITIEIYILSPSYTVTILATTELRLTPIYQVVMHRHES